MLRQFLSRLTNAQPDASPDNGTRSIAPIKEVSELKSLRERVATLKIQRNSLRALAEEAKLLRAELDKLPRFAFGSYTPGIHAWQEKWKASEPHQRVLLYAPKDFSGSFFKWAQAINEHSDYAARLVTIRTHPYGYKTDLVMPDPRITDSQIGELVEQAGLIHVKDENGNFEGRPEAQCEAVYSSGKPLIFTHYGGYARKYRHDESYRAYVARFADRIAMTPDLAYDWFDGEFIPHAIDTSDFTYSWKDGATVGHSPSTAARKGTDDFLKATGKLNLPVDLISGVSHSECIARKRQCSLFFDQAGREQAESLGVDDVIGWYGNSALEAAVFGIPTIAHLSEVALERAEQSGVPDIRKQCGILNTERGSEGIARTLRAFFEADEGEREAISRRTRSWMESFHSYEAVADRLSAVYRRVL